MPTPPEISEHDKVVNAIAGANSSNFVVKSNVGEPKHYIGNIFPDLILCDKTTQNPVFIIEVRRNGNIAPSMQQWKTAISIPATLYFVVPEQELPTAKSVAQVIGLKARFGSYKLDEGNGNVIVKYE